MADWQKMLTGVSSTSSNNGASASSEKARKKQATTAQRTIPYIDVYPNGMIQSEPGVFCKLYQLPEANFKTLSDEEQNNFFDKYETFLNSIEANEHVQFILLNTVDDIDLRFAKMKMQEQGDFMDHLREEMNDIIHTKLVESRGSIITNRYLCYSVREKSVDAAAKHFKDLDLRVAQEMRTFLKKEVRALTIDEYLEVLAEIYGTSDNPLFHHDEKGNTTVDFDMLKKTGMTTKDLIAPPAFKFSSNRFIVGEEVAQSMYLSGIANFLSTDFVGNLMDINAKLLISIDVQPLDQAEGTKIVHNKKVMINSELVEKQKAAVKSGYSPDLIGGDLEIVKDQVEQLERDMQSRDQRVFYFQMNLTAFGNTVDELDRTKAAIKSVQNQNLCHFTPFVLQQENGFNASLPLNTNHTYMKRLLTTENMAAFMPFTETSTLDEHGFYYGLNSVNKSVIFLDRMKGMNYNGLILGASGSGKSFAAKMLMINAILNSNAYVYVIDPDGEYSAIANELGGTVIKIAPGNGVHLNPFDLDMDTSIDETTNPLAQQADFVTSLCDTMMQGGVSRNYSTLTPAHKSLINKVLTRLYQSYIRTLSNENPDPVTGRQPTIDRRVAPTLQDLMKGLLEYGQDYPEAQELALNIEMFCGQGYDSFASRTDVDIDKRLIVFDIHHIGSTLEELGLKVCLNMIWTKATENALKGRLTYAFIDEFHMLLRNETSSETVKTMWKRARKFGLVLTGITQNVEDLLQSPDARSIINNTNFIEMLNQAMLDREALRQMLSLNETEISYINGVDSGHGLIHIGTQNIPFENNFPTDTELYRIMSTKPKDAEQA